MKMERINDIHKMKYIFKYMCISLCICLVLTACGDSTQEESNEISETSEQEISSEDERTSADEIKDKLADESTTVCEDETNEADKETNQDVKNIDENTQDINNSDTNNSNTNNPNVNNQDTSNSNANNIDENNSNTNNSDGNNSNADNTEEATEPPQNEIDIDVANLPVDPDYGYSITSYADKSGNQGMFYTIRNNSTGALIVIDGGWSSNEVYVRKVIASKGNVVDAWIITHFHNDHVDAVSAILEEPKGITIKQIYDSPYDYEKYASVAQSWDRRDCFERYLNISKQYSNVTHLNEGDEFEIAGLNFFVFNAYSDRTENYGDLCNNGSLMFKVSSGSSSMIFCGDCHTDELGYDLIEKYGEKLKCDYVQLGHHGNASFSSNIYEYMEPKGVVFDAPEWLMKGDSFTAKELKEFFESKGVICYDYTMGANQIVISQ